MSDVILEKNIQRLIGGCVARVTEEQIQRSLSAVERRKRPGGRQGRLVAGAAAAAVVALAVGLALWKPGGLPGRAQDPPKPEEVHRLVGELGSTDAEIRERAKMRLAVIGAPALEALDKAIYHEDPDVRIRARDLAKAIRDELATKAAVDPILDSIRKIRRRWTARDFSDISEVAREAFKPRYRLTFVHYVPKKEVGEQLEYARDGKGRDVLSVEIVEALEKNEGIVFVNRMKGIVPFDKFCFFTLPDKKGWSAYMIIEFSEPPRAVSLKGTILAQSDNREVWGFTQEEIAWLDFNKETILESLVQLNPQNGKLMVEKITPSSLADGRGLLPGDILIDVNGIPVRTLAEVREALANPAVRGASSMRIVLERAGKVFHLEYRPLAK